MLLKISICLSQTNIKHILESQTMRTSLHGSTAFYRKKGKGKKKKKKSTIKEVKLSEQILPAKVRTILHRHARVLSHQQTTNIKYRLTATDSESFSLWNTVIWAQHSAQLSFVRQNSLTWCSNRKVENKLNCSAEKSPHFSVFWTWWIFKWIFDTFLKNPNARWR